MTKWTSPLLVGSKPSIQQILALAGVREIPASDIATYKNELVAAYPGTQFGDWMHRKMIPTRIFYTVGTILAGTVAISSLLLLLLCFSSQVEASIALRVTYGIGSLIGWVATAFLVALLSDTRPPSYWVRFSWPKTKGEQLGFVMIAAEAKTMQENIARLAPVGTEFKVDVFYKNGVREDPIGYVIDPTDHSEHAFAVWFNNDLIKV